MKITHNYINGTAYIYANIEYNTEFGKEFFDNDKKTPMVDKLKNYISKNLKKEDKAVLILNGVLIGTIIISTFLGSSQLDLKGNKSDVEAKYIVEKNNVQIEEKKDEEKIETQENKDKIIENEQEDMTEENKEEVKEILDSPNIIYESTPIMKKEPEKIVKEEPKTNITEVVDNTSVIEIPTVVETPKTEVEETPKVIEKSPEIIEETPIVESPVISSSYTIRLSSNGVIETMDLEEYIIGVVAAEMPASFHLEALKAQAVAARTFAVKKSEAGITLLNSTTHQVYKNESQMRALWGDSYDYYYNRIASAVNSTKSLVLKYNGSYIDALYHSMSNGKTELPKYVWGGSFGYLQSVSSSWDTSYSNFEVDKKFTYVEISSKLGDIITSDSVFEVDSRTVSDRVENIWINGKLYSGVDLRSKLGLRSTDFTISKDSIGVTFTTKGFGHGVGMSQYGANGAAKNGYSYSDILKHYYTGVSIVSQY